MSIINKKRKENILHNKDIHSYAPFILLALAIVVIGLLFLKPSLTGLVVENATQSDETNITINYNLTEEVEIYNESINQTNETLEDNSTEEIVSDDNITQIEIITIEENITENLVNIESKKPKKIIKSKLLSLRNKNKQELKAKIKLIKDDQTIKEFLSDSLEDIQEDTYDIEIEPEDSPIKKIVLENIQLYEKADEIIRIDDVPETGKHSNWKEIYAIDPSAANFTNGTVTAVAKGTELYKCKTWNYEERECDLIKACSDEIDEKGNNKCRMIGGWVKIMDIIPGQEYIVNISPEDPGYAEYSAALTAPYCTGESPCIANSSLLRCRDSVNDGNGPEPNQPNTIDACTDGASTSENPSCGGDESVENITIESLNHSDFRKGDTINVTAWVHCWPGGPANDNINLVYTSNATSPSWTVKDFIDPCPGAGYQQVSSSWILDNMTGNHTVRVIIQYNGNTADTCGTGDYDDTDDIVFYVREQNSPPSNVTSITCDGGNCNNSFTDDVEIQCSGSVDSDNDIITYVIEADYGNYSCKNSGTCGSCGTEEICDNCSGAGCSWSSGSSASIVYYFDSWSDAGTWDDTSPDEAVDGNLGTTSNDNNDGHYFVMGTNNYTGGGVGTITSVEVRSYWKNNDATTNIRDIAPNHKAVFGGSALAVSDYTNNCGTESGCQNLHWGPWWDITNDANAPVTWTWADIQNMDMRIVSNRPNSGRLDIAKTEIRVNYTQLSTCSGSLDCTSYSSQSTCENCSQCVWNITSQYSVIGNHTNGSSYTWDISLLPDQTNIDLRCRAIDLNGTSTYTDYFDPSINLTIQNLFVNINLTNPDGDSLDYTYSVLNETNGLYDILINVTNEDVSQMIIRGYNESVGGRIIFESETNETWGEQDYAVAAEGMSYTNITLTLTATGTHLFKCLNWSMDNLTCNDDEDWDTVQLITPGQEYNLTINEADPGFVELTIADIDILNDGYADQANPGTEWGARANMRIANFTGGNMHSLIMFNLSKIPSNVIIDEAIMTLRCTGESLEAGESIEVGAHLVYSNFSWTEGTGGNGGNACTGSEFCWNNRPDDSQFNQSYESVNIIPDGCSGTFYHWNVTDMIKYTFDLNHNNISIYLLPNGNNLGTVTNDSVRFNTKESAAARRPRLNITFHTIPQVKDVQPSAGSQYLPGTLILISANVTDYSPQINISSVIANVTWDSYSQLLTLTDPDSDNIYTGNFTNTSTETIYNVTIIANNTGGYVNDSETTWFDVTQAACTNPIQVTQLLPPVPPPIAEYNQSELFLIGADVRSTQYIDKVYANVSIPGNGWVLVELFANGTITEETNLTNKTVENKTIEGGSYNITFKCQDNWDIMNGSNPDCTIKILSTFQNCIFVQFDDAPQTAPEDFDMDIEAELCVEENNTAYKVNFTRTDYEAGHNVSIGYIINTTYGVNNESGWVLDITRTNYSATYYKTGGIYGAYYTGYYNNSILGIYNITILSNNTNGCTNNTEKTAFKIVDGEPPNVTLNYPSPDYVNDSQQPLSLLFNCSVTDNTELKNISLYITNSTNQSFALYQTTNISGTSNESTWSLNLFNGNYTWNCLAYDNASNLDWGINRTIRINATGFADTIKPTINLNFPPNSYNTSSTSINFNWTVTDNYDTNLSCNLTINGTVNQSNIPSLNGTSTNYTISGFTDGLYYWNVTCVDDSGNVNTSETRQFTIDTTHPAVTLNFPSDNYNTSSTTINFNWTATNGLDPVLDCNLTVNGTIYANIASPSNVATNYSISGFTDGLYYWNVTCIDDSGNVNSSETRTFTIDTAKPAVVLNFPPNNYNTSSTTINFNWTASNGLDPVLDCNLTVNGTVYANIASPSNVATNYSISGFTDGLYYWNVTCVDDSGNVNTSETRTFTIDTNKPAVELNFPPDNYNTSMSTINFNWTATNGVDPVLDCNLTVNGTVYPDISSQSGVPTNYSVFGLNNGTYVWNVTCIDDSGNVNTSETRTFTIDGVPPTFISVQPNGTVYNQTDNVTLSVCVSENSTLTANVSWDSTSQYITLVFNGTEWCYEYIFTNTTYPGDYNVTINATDTYGNSNTTNTTFIVKDITPPSVVIISPTLNSNYTLNSTVPISVNVTDYYYDNMGTVIANITWDATFQTIPLIFNLGTGLWEGNFTNTTAVDTYNVTIIATDNASNTNSTEFVLFNVIDNIPPIVNLISPINNTNISTQTQGFTFNFTDNYYTTASCTLYVNGIPSGTNSSTNAGTPTTITNSSLPEGVNTWYINCTDLSNNSGISETRTLTVDLTPPVITIIRPTNNDIVGYNVTLDVDVTDALTQVENVTYIIINSTGQAVSSGSLPGPAYQYIWDSTTVPDGNYTFLVYANDTVGNLGNLSTNFTVDNTQPFIQILYPTNGTIFNTNFNLNITYQNTRLNITSFNITNSSGNVVQFNITNNVNSNYDEYLDLVNITTLQDGIYNITAYALDYVGYSSTESVLFIVDKTAPAYFSLTETPSDPATYSPGQTYEFNSTWTDLNGVNTVILEFNGTNYTVNSATDIYSQIISDLPAGIYFYIWYANDTIGNQNDTGLLNYTINRDTTILTLNITPSWNETYPTQTTINCTANTPQAIPLLYFNNNLVSNPYTTTHGVGTYNYTCNASQSQNYTSAETSNLLTISQAIPTCSLILVPLSPQVYPTAINVSCSCTNPEAFEELYRNGTNVTLENNQLVILPAGDHYYNCTTPATQNYTLAENTSTYTILKSNHTIHLAINGTETDKSYVYPTQTNATGWLEINESINNANLYRNGNNVDTGSPSVEIITLPAGTYNYTYNYSESQNYTRQEVSRILEINKSLTILTLTPYPAWSVFNGTQTSINCTSNNNEVNFTLYRNTTYIGSSIGGVITDTQTLPPGSYLYTCNTSGTINYTNASTSDTLTVSLKNMSQCNLIFDPVSGQTYPVNLNVSCVCSNPETTAQLYRNNTNVTDEIDQFVDLAAETYLYVCNASETVNFMYAENISTYLINKNSTEINLTLNNIDNNLTIESGNNVVFNVTLIPIDRFSNLYENDNLLKNGTTPFSYTKQYITPGAYLIKANYSGNQNYTYSEEIHYLTVQDTTVPVISFISPTPSDNLYTNINTHIINVTHTELNPDTLIMIIDGIINESIPYSSGFTNFTKTFADGIHNYSVIINDTSGLSATTETRTIIVDTTIPKVDIISPAPPGKQVANGSVINIDVNVTDPILNNISSVIANVTWDSTYETINMTYNSGTQLWEGTFSNTTEIYNYTVNIIATDFAGNVNNTETTNLITNSSIIDIISTTVFPPVLGIGQIENLSMNVTGPVDTCWVIITYPNATQITLTDPCIGISFIAPNLTGQYNVTFFANSTLGQELNETGKYFLVGEPLLWIANVIDNNLTGIDSELKVYYTDTRILLDLQSNGLYVENLSQFTFDLLFTAYNSSIDVFLRDVNITKDNNQTIGLDKILNYTGFAVVYGIMNDNYTFTTADVEISYNNTNYTDENNLQLQVCDDWNFTSQICSSGWVTLAAIKDTNLKIFNFTRTGFSAFGITEPAADSSSVIPSGGLESMRVSVDGNCKDTPIKIKVTKIDLDSPIYNVNVKTYGKDTFQLNPGYTDNNGEATFIFAQEGKYLLEFIRTNYNPEKVSINIIDCAECHTDEDCESDEYCSDEICEKLDCGIINDHRCVECNSDPDCNLGYNCIDHNCIAAEITSEIPIIVQKKDCSLFGINLGKFIICWYWWLLIFLFLFIIILRLNYSIWQRRNYRTHIKVEYLSALLLILIIPVLLHLIFGYDRINIIIAIFIEVLIIILLMIYIYIRYKINEKNNYYQNKRKNIDHIKRTLKNIGILKKKIRRKLSRKKRYLPKHKQKPKIIFDRSKKKIDYIYVEKDKAFEENINKNPIKLKPETDILNFKRRLISIKNRYQIGENKNNENKEKKQDKV